MMLEIGETAIPFLVQEASGATPPVAHDTGARRTRAAAADRVARRLRSGRAVLALLAAMGFADAARATTPGTPGTPQPPTSVYQEDFQNRPGPAPIVRLTGYAGVTGQAYTAAAVWLTACNGWIASANESTTAAAQVADCGASQNVWNSTQQLADALGLFKGESAADAANNYAVSAFTAANPGAGQVEFQTATNIPFVTSNRFVAFSVDVAAVNCNVSAPLLQFYLLNGSGAATAAGTQINGCTSPSTVNAPAVGTAGARAINVGTYTANGAVLISGSSIGVRMLNNNGSGVGNDHAFDNIQILDVSPQLDKSFSPTTTLQGGTSALKFTITNTTDLGAKSGWSFTDTLPAGLTVAAPAATTTCPSAVVTAAVGSGSITVSGNLSAGMASCTATVNVTSATAGTYNNGPGNVTGVGLNPPGSATVSFLAFDFGDAPDTYGTLLASNGAQHAVSGFDPTAKTAPLMLGSHVSIETDGQPSAAAAQDTFDDGLIPGSVSLLPGATTAQVTVRAVNATASAATLAGWIDFNNNGTFDAGERAQVTVPANTTTPTSFVLNWSGLAPLPISFTSYLRLRIATNAADVAAPTGLAADGEVEDYRVPTVTAFAGCDTRAFLFQGTPADVFSIDLVTGGSTPVGNDISPNNINAVGFNPLDNYIYGIDSTGVMVRVGSDFSVQSLGLPSGLLNNTYNVGEFDNNGHYWVTTSAAGATVYEVDLRPGSPTYFQVVSARPLNDIAGIAGGADWAYNPVDGYLYRTPTNATSGRMLLFRYDRVTGQQTNLGPIAGIPADTTILIGANYSDAAGFVYASDNTSGRIYRINTATNAGTLLSTGPLSGTNDGARCFNAPVPIDFGDAPDSYGTLLASNGARHSVPNFNAAAKTAPLMLGSRISVEADGQPSSDASSDLFDDGLVPGSVSLVAGATTAQVVIKAINAKATAATLAGWIDFNNNGVFDPGERAQVTVPANTTTSTAFTLNWSGIPALPSAFSAAARFRIATVAAQVASPVGAAADGEVEDYLVPVTLPVVDCSTSPSIFNTGISASGGMLPTGSRDRNWDAGIGTPSGGPASVSSWIDAYVVGNASPANWVNSPFGNANWTSFYSNATQPGTANVDEYHRFRFTLDPAVVPSSFALGIDFYADNSIWEVYVNGVPQSGLVAGLPQSPSNPYQYAGYAAGRQAHLTLNRSWQSGTNEIVVQVRSGYPLVGFLGQVTSTGLCPAQVGVTKSADPPGDLIPGGTVTYTVTATNTGLVAAPNTVISDPLPAGITSGTWTCAGSGGAVCPNATGTLPLNQTVATFPGGGVLIYTITGSVDANPPASIANTVSATPPGNNGQCFPNNTAPPCTATVTNPPVPIVSVTKTTSATQAVPGGAITYALTVRNTGSVAADGTTVSDPVPAGLGSVTWTCTATGGAACPNDSGSGAISETIATFPAGGQLVYTISAIVDANPPAAVTNTASSTPPGDGLCSDGSVPPCTGTATVPAAPQVSVVKTASPADVLTPGGTVTYTITVSNDGSTAAPNTLVRDGFPTGIDSATWTCAATAGAACPNAASTGTVVPPGDMLNESILTFPPGSTVTYTISAAVSATPPANVVNTVSASPPGGVCLPANSPPPCSSTVIVPPVPIVAVTKTADASLLVPGGTVTYTVTVSNVGSVAADGTLVSDPIPDGLTTPYTWTCAASGGALCPNASGGGAIAESIETFPAGSAVVYTITATVVANPPAEIGNVVSVTPPGGICADGSAVPCTGTTDTPVAPQVNVTKTSADANAAPGGTLSWTVTVSNVGNAGADGTFVSDPLPAGITSSTWTCAAAGGAACPSANGSGGIAETIAVFPAGSSVVYTVVGVVDLVPPTTIGNTVSVTPPGGGLCLPGNTLPPCTDGTTTPSAPNVTIAKSVVDASGDGIAEPGEQLTYTIVLSNSGGSDAIGYSVTDPLDANVGFVSADNGGTFAGSTVSWSGLTVPAQGSVTLTLIVTVNTPIPPGTATIGNVVYETGTPPPACPPAGPQCVITPTAAQVTTTKALTAENGSEPGIAEPGEQLTYTITLTNAGGSDATGYAESDRLDANTSFVSASDGGTFAAGVVDWTGLTVPAGGSKTLTVIVSVNTPIPAGVTRIGNVAYQAGTTPPACPPAGPQCVVTPTAAQVTTTKALTAESGTQPGIAEPGEQLTYTITLTNSGGSDATGYAESDRLDVNTSFVSASDGGTFATGVVDWTGITVPANGSKTLTVVVSVNTPIPPGVTQLGNVAYPTGTPPPPCPPAGPQCVVTPTSAQVTTSKALTAESGTQPGIAEPGEQLTYTITLSNDGGSDATGYAESDRLDPNTSFVSASNGGTFAAGVVNWSGLTVPAGGTLALTVVVRVATPIPPGVTQLGNVAYPTGTPPPPCPPAGPQCVVTPTAAHVLISKTASAPAPTGNPNEYQLTYVATVKNDGGSGDAYTLNDTLTFNGATVSAISAPLYASPNGQVQDGTPGSFTAPSGGTIVTGEDIDAGGIETWTYTVTYTVTDASTADNCADPNGGLRNSAIASGNTSGSAPAAATCTGAPSVNLLKTASAPTPTGNPNEFTLVYTVNVSNAGSQPGHYDLADTLSFNGATVSAISAPVYSSSTGDTQDGTLGAFAAPSGGSIVTGETISAGGAETWTYTVTYTITDAASAENCADPAGGLRNDAALGGSLTGESTTCTGAPAIVIGKSASGPTPTGAADTYTLTYLVTVQNNGTLPGTYDLADTFTFPGVSGVTVGPVQHGGSDPLSGALGTLTPSGGSIVAGETIAAGSSETYTYVVTFTLDDVATVGNCASGGGLVNHAVLGGSASGQVGTCSDVPSLSIAKVASAPTPTGTPNQYAIAYTVTVANAGAAQGSYDLADAFTFAGATIDAVSVVTHAGPDPLATTLGTLSPSGGTIVTGETIAGASSESYTYTVTFTLTDPAAANDCTAPTGGLRNVATLGGSVAGQAQTCSGAPSVTIAKALSLESGSQPGIAEPGETLTYTITLSNSGTTPATNYAVSDPLDANVSFVSADNGGTFAGGTVTWSGLTVPAGGSLALSVVVTVNAPIPSGVATIGNLAYATGSTPPDCSATPTPPACVVTPTPGVVSIAKSVSDANGNGLAEPGETLTYTITLSNVSGGDAVNYGVTDPLDANTLFVGADNGGTSAGGVVSWSGLTVPAGGTLVLHVTVTVADPLPAGVTQIGNLVYATGATPPDCTAVPQPANCAVIPVPTPGAVTIVKAVADASGDGIAQPGEALTYTITLSNTGGQAVGGYGVTDPLDANTLFFSADNGGTNAGGVVTWAGLTIPAGGSLALHVVVTVADPLPAGVTQIGNLAYATGGTPPDCTAVPRPVNCTVIPVPAPGAITIVKAVADASGDGVAQPGEALTYTITLSNSGGQAVSGYGVTDPLDANTLFVSADNGGTNAGGVVTWAGLTIPAGGSLALHVVVTVVDPLPAGVDRIGNLAYATGGTPPDCTATPLPPNCAVIVTPPAGAPRLSITKTTSTPTLRPGGTAVYTITVSNVGTATASNATIQDPIAVGFDGYTWTCAASGGASCANASGSGAIAETIAVFPAGGTLVYTVTATVSAHPPATIANIASATPPGIGTCAPAGSPPPCSASSTISVIVPQPIAPVPSLDMWMLTLLGLGLIGVAWRAGRNAG